MLQIISAFTMLILFINIVQAFSTCDFTTSPNTVTIGSGEQVIMTSQILLGCASPSYQWYTAPSAGTCSDTYTPISGATANSYTGNPTATTYYCLVIDSGGTFYNSGTSNIIISTTMPTPALSSCPSSTTLDAGETVSCTASVPGGVSPYAYNWLISNSITNAIAANVLFTGISLVSNSFSHTTLSADVANSPEQLNVIVTDSNSNTVNSIYSSTFVINPDLSTLSLTPSNPSIDSGQSVTFTSTWSGGTTDYTAKLYSSSTSTCNTGSTLFQTLSYLTSGSASFTAVSPNSTTYYCIFVTDSATTPTSATSGTDLINVNPALGTPTLSSSPTLPSTQAVGNTITFTSSWSGGTAPYTANYLIVNTITGSLIANALYTGITGTTNSFAWTIPLADGGNTVQANIIVTDSASTPESTNSINSGTLTITALSPSVPAVIVPANMLYYIPIKFTNSQTAGIPNPFQLATTVNSLEYGNYEASNLQNIEFFYANGTIVPSWLEGNSLNSAQSTNLYTSENTLYWLNVVGNFLPASSSNTLYMGFAATGTNLLNGASVGEAPLLSKICIFIITICAVCIESVAAKRRS